MSAEQQREQEQVVGQLTGIIQKGPDKWQAVVLPEGSQYPKNLWTKDAPLIQTLSGRIGSYLAFLCNASYWNRQDGQQVRSLWIEAVGEGAAAPPPPVTQPQNAWDTAQQAQQSATVQPQPVQMTVPNPQAVPAQGAFSQDDREQRIHRQTASKVAAIMLTHVQPEERTMSTLFVLAERLVAYYNTGLPAPEAITLDDLIVQATPRTVDEGPPPLPADDDIPF